MQLHIRESQNVLRVRRHRRRVQEHLCRYGKGEGRSHTHPEEGRRQAHRTREEANSDTAERREGEEAQADEGQ